MTAQLPKTTAPRSAPAWWQRPWIGPLLLVVAAFLGFSVPRYLTFDPALSQLEVPEGDAVYYPILVAHVLFGAVAMVASCFQIWPRFRRRHWRGHKITGRIYVFGGVLPAGVLGLYIGWNTPFGPSVRVANLLIAVLWITVTVIALRMARRRRVADHRKWMIRSFALTMSIIMSRVINVPAIITLAGQTDTAFGGSETLMLQTATSIGVWLSLVVSLLLAEWGVERQSRFTTGRSPSSG
ncbi:DUF2306 domain-containing protein [Nonomuraea longicatena]|uniref:DUF2306 domain-containing protein n=1 Tax=Nonomuraea longicatena TaxID=83682 RepID=A0ABN1QKE6_9ACTN